MVKGLRVECNQEIVIEVSMLSHECYIFEDYMDPCLARAQFTLHRDMSLEIDRKKDTRWISIHEPYNQCDIYIM